MTDRRDFLASVTALGGWLAAPAWIARAATALRVDAISTVFFAQPDGWHSLIRFTVTGLDAPAGRLRVYDRARRLLGTAGVLRRNDALYGELWVPLPEATTVISELEAPGLRGPVRSSHSLAPQRRWTLHLLTAADPAEVTQSLQSLAPVRRALQTAGYIGYHVAVNPLPHSLPQPHLGHVPFLRMAEVAQTVEREFGIPMSDAAVIRGEMLQGNAILALAGSGVQVVSLEHTGGEPFQWLVGPDGSRLLAVVTPPGGDTTTLGFTKSPEVMTQRIERWITQSPLFSSPEYQRSAAVIVNTASDRELAQLHRSIGSWNSRFAFPKITVGRADPLLDLLEQSRGVAIREVKPGPRLRDTIPSRIQLAEMATAAHEAATDRTSQMFAILARVLGSEEGGVEAIASSVAAIVPGTVVFNPSPFSRSGLVTMTDGTERLATNVPGLGYAYFPDTMNSGEHEGWAESGTGYRIEGERFRITIDRASGSIASMIDSENGREWVRSGSHGLNGVAASRLDSSSQWTLPGLATRLVIRRWSPGRGNLRSTVTVYDNSPWVDIENEAEAVGAGAVEYRFDLAIAQPMVSWEVAAASETIPAPVELLEHLRWLRLAGPDDAMLVRCIDAPLASVQSNGSLLSHAPPGRSRYRLRSETNYEGLDSPWVFGWGTEPFLTARVEPGDSPQLPTFGNILDIERVGVAVLGMVTAHDGGDAIVYLQELVGVDRQVSVASGLMRFQRARIVDYLERDSGASVEPRDGRALIPIKAHGVVAVRLSGLELNAE
ncbi:MAG: hypothetical protein JSW71_00290 [Gemmatimonadota bacterium]|nr:MAG: hypothetical protein JSW71_00290 [Gemmatimonadota bacterium]